MNKYFSFWWLLIHFSAIDIITSKSTHTQNCSPLFYKKSHIFVWFFITAAHTNPKISFSSALKLDVPNFYILDGLYHTHLWCVWLDFCVLVMSMKGSYYCNTCLQLSCSFTHFVYRRVFTACLPSVSLMSHFIFQAISIFEELFPLYDINKHYLFSFVASSVGT